MKDVPSIAQLQSLLQADEMVHPSFAVETLAVLGPVRQVIERVGLPKRIADWFHAVDHIALDPEAKRFHYTVNEREYAGENGIRLGTNDFGSFVLDPKSGCLVYVEPHKYSQLINTSIERFLYFVGRINRSTDCGFSDIDQLKKNCLEMDPAPLSDPDGIWSFTLEEAANGLYG